MHILGIILHLHCNNPFLPGRLLRNGQFTPKRTELLVTTNSIRDEKLFSVQTSVKVMMHCSSLSESADDLVSNQLVCTLSSSF